MSDKFEIIYTGHANDSEELLLSHFPASEIVLMTNEMLENHINENYICYKCGEDWLVIPKEKEKEFNKMANWICR